ncbi:hypothetical protein COBT_004105, partial [Conglomerata obtusa]
LKKKFHNYGKTRRCVENLIASTPIKTLNTLKTLLDASEYIVSLKIIEPYQVRNIIYNRLPENIRKENFKFSSKPKYNKVKLELLKIVEQDKPK